MDALRRFLPKAGLVLGSVLLTLAVTECGVRALNIAPLQSTAAGGFRADSPLLRLLQPDACRDFGKLDGPYFAEVCTNRFGLRDRNHAPMESPRVLGLGDSFTFGWGVEQGDTFLAHLERALRLGLPAQRPGVFNAGLSYTSQVHQDALLRHLLRNSSEVRPDVVVLAFSEDNDIDENIVWNPNAGVFPEHGEISTEAVDAYRDEIRGVVRDDYLYRQSALVRFFRQRSLRASVAAEVSALDERLASHGLAGAPLSRMVADEARRRFLQAFSSKYDDDWRVTEILLDRIQSLTVDQGAKLILLRIPSRMSVEDRAWDEARQRFCGSDAATAEKACGALDRNHTGARLEAHAARRGLLYVDPSKDLSAAARRGEVVYWPEDIHLSRLGHARVGEHLARTIVPHMGGPTRSEPATGPEAAPGKRLVGAYWYPWYKNREWSAFTDYTPAGGAYVSSDRETILRQLHRLERAEVDFVILELLPFYNPESAFNDRAIDGLLEALMERRRRGYSHMKFAILSDILFGEMETSTHEAWVEMTRRQLDLVWKRFVERYPDAYVRIDGKPLVGIYSPPVSVDDGRFHVIRPFWAPHEQWEGWERNAELIPFWDTYPQAVPNPRFVSVTPGYNDWRLDRQVQLGPHLPRGDGRTFVKQWQRAFEVNPEVVLVYSYNEYFEQSQIEPTVEQGDRYLLLNQLLARRFKDGRPLGADESERLADVLEPPPKPQKAVWVPVDDPRVAHRGLEPAGEGRAALHGEAELSLEVDAEQAFVIGIAHAPTFDRCVALRASLESAGHTETTTFATEVTQLAVLRDAPQKKGSQRLKVRLERVPAAPECRMDGRKPVVLQGVVRYTSASDERQKYPVDHQRIQLESFWNMEQTPHGAFAWTQATSRITVSQMAPGARYRVTLAFRDIVDFTEVSLGPDPEQAKPVPIVIARRTATSADALTVSPDGKLHIGIRTPTWRPSDKYGSDDRRDLGLALTHVTLDRLE